MVEPFDGGDANGRYGQQVDPISQPRLIEFTGPQMIFPPPEKWVENEYQNYEEHAGGSQNISDQVLKRQTVAWAIRDTVDLSSNMLRIPKDSYVFVIEVYPEAQICRVSYNHQVGVFKIYDFTHNGPGAADQPESNSTNQRVSSHKQTLSMDQDTLEALV